MAGGINWALIGSGNNALASFDYGMRLGENLRQRREDRELRKALGALGDDNPANDEAAQALVYQRNPELAMRIGQDRERREFNAAVSNYMLPGGQPNAMLGIGPQPSPPATPSAPGGAPAQVAGMNALLGPVGQGTSFEDAFAPLTPPQPVQQQGPQADFSFLGQPRNQQDAAFLRMVRLDPIKALEIQSDMRDSFLDRVKAEQTFYGEALGELSRMTDDAGWQRGLQRLAPMANALGVDLLSVVPTTYPGPDAVRELLENALPIKERLDYFLREANYEADNERADRNTDSLIEDRRARRSEQRRYNEQRIATTRRGQDLTDRRSRDSLPVVRTPREALALPAGTKFRSPDGVVRIVPKNPKND